MMVTAVAAVVAAACAKERPVIENVSVRDEIIFDVPSLSPATKEVYEGTSFPDIPFYVWADYNSSSFVGWDTGEPYISRAKVMRTSGIWKTDPTFYWPNVEGSTLSFFAFSHGGGIDHGFLPEVGVDGEGIYIKDYIASRDGSQTDMFVSDAMANMNSGTVSFNFNHILSVVDFEVRLEDAFNTMDFRSFILHDITLENLVFKGSFSQGLSDSDVSGTGPLHVKGKMEWTLGTDADDAGMYANILNSGMPVTKFQSSGAYDGVVGKDVVIIPQKTLRSSGGHVRLRLEGTLETASGTESVDRVINLSDLGFDEFKPGRKYTFSLTITKS